ncbi:hypothetical protein A1O3_05597 [Capronia epimyces CBS 606.96]|uniref:Uncharacterized protein n=1 Tax=Capronia epimyces CBS 606.96 TaxID=1182542 RepID=W9XWJ6_9EURO|nr:uncharacterized protein A1O3_05597 [Capronia epimyces CBS 606.96]EXJ84922.1 hypothetical protein A1O3_05597 [Capronia epimyces CBS 606.96]
MELSILEPVFRLPVNQEDLSIEVLSLTHHTPSSIESVPPKSDNATQLQLGRRVFSTAQPLQDHLGETKRDKYLIQVMCDTPQTILVMSLSLSQINVRLSSLTKENSYAPMDVDKGMLEAVLACHDVMPPFQQVILAFRPKTNRLEEAYSEPLSKRQRKNIVGESKLGVTVV